MVDIPVIILKDQVRALVSSFSCAVEVVTSTSPFNMATPIQELLDGAPLHGVSFNTEVKSCLAASVSLLLNCLWDGSGFQFWHLNFCWPSSCAACALVCLTLVFDVGAERFALVSSACFFCLFLLGVMREVKATSWEAHGGVWGHLVAVQRLRHGLVVWAFWADTGTGDPCRNSLLQGSVDQNVGAQRWRSFCVESGESTAFGLQEVRAGLSHFCELMQWWDLLVPVKHSLVLHILCGTEGKIFSLCSHSPTPTSKVLEGSHQSQGIVSDVPSLHAQTPTLPWPFLWAFFYHTRYQEMKCYENFASSSQMGGRT